MRDETQRLPGGAADAVLPDCIPRVLDDVVAPLQESEPAVAVRQFAQEARQIVREAIELGDERLKEEIRERQRCNGDDQECDSHRFAATETPALEDPHERFERHREHDRNHELHENGTDRVGEPADHDDADDQQDERNERSRGDRHLGRCHRGRSYVRPSSLRFRCDGHRASGRSPASTLARPDWQRQHDLTLGSRSTDGVGEITERLQNRRRRGPSCAVSASTRGLHRFGRRRAR